MVGSLYFPTPGVYYSLIEKSSFEGLNIFMARYIPIDFFEQRELLV